MKLRSVLPAIIGLGVVAALAACGPDYAADKAPGTGGGAAAPAPYTAAAASVPRRMNEPRVIPSTRTSASEGTASSDDEGRDRIAHLPHVERAGKGPVR